MANSIKDLLDSLPEGVDDSNLPEWEDKFRRYYEENERHSYSEITSYIFEKSGGIEYVRELLPKLKKVHGKMDAPDVKANLGKLIDHISLELVRYDQLLKIILSTVENQYAEMMNGTIAGFNDVINSTKSRLEETKDILAEQKNQMEDIKESGKRIDKNLKDTEKNIENAKKNIEDAENKVNSLQTENVAILGIFASIVFAFTGLITFTNSMLENMAEVSAYRLFFICLFAGLVFLNVIGVLVNGLKRIVYWKSLHKQEKGFCSTLGSWMRENTLWLAGDLLLIFLLGCVWFGWEHSAEKKSLDLNYEVHMQDYEKALENGSISGNEPQNSVSENELQ